MGIENYFVFIVTAGILAMTPGVDSIFVLNRTLFNGKGAGISSALGILTGLLVHTLLSALGLSVILAQSAVAFAIVKYCGALYLVYLGLAKLISKNKGSVENGAASVSHSKNFYTGLITNTLNPKVAIFFLAFFPQFINPVQLSNPVPFLLLGLTFIGIGVIWFALLITLSSFFSNLIKGKTSFNRWVDKISGMVFIGLGLKIAFERD
jgi:threonine/homoserine/homoserine lactone efflux protein